MEVRRADDGDRDLATAGALPPHLLVAQVARLRAKVQQLKGAIKANREHLQETAAELDRIEAAARARGITIATVVVPSTRPQAQE